MYCASLGVEFHFTSNELKFKAINSKLREIITKNRNFCFFQMTNLKFIELHQYAYQLTQNQKLNRLALIKRCYTYTRENKTLLTVRRTESTKRREGVISLKGLNWL